MDKAFLEDIIPEGEKDIFGIDEMELPEDEPITLQEKIKDICRFVLDKDCSSTISKKDTKGEMKVSISEFLTDAEVRSIIPEIEALAPVKKVEHVDIPEDGDKSKTTTILLTLEK